MTGRRVLHVTDCYSTGVGRAIDTIVALTPQHEHHLLWAGEDDPGGRGFATMRRLPGTHLARVAAVAREVRRTSCDLVHAHSSRAGLYARARPLPVEVVYQPHCYKLLDPSLAQPLRRAVTLVERGLAHRADRVVVLSAEEDALAARLSPVTPRTLLPNAPSLDPGDGSLPHDPPEAGERPRRVVMTGRVARQKDPTYFAAVAVEVRRRDPSVDFRWVGGADDPGLTRLLEDVGVTVTGWRDAAELVEELRGAGAYLHSAAYEGFPLSVLDAAWCATPVLVRDIRAFDGTGLARVGDVADAATRVLEVLDGGPAFASALCGSRTVLEQMSTRVQRERLAEVYG